jgi:hypothetical protein
MINLSNQEVIDKTVPKYELNNLLSKYKTDRVNITTHENNTLYKQLTILLKTPVNKVLTNGWRSPHGAVLHVSSDIIGFEELINETIVETLEKVNEYNTEFSASNFTYLKLSDILRKKIIPKYSTSLTMSKEYYEGLNSTQREIIKRENGLEELIRKDTLEQTNQKTSENTILIQEIINNILNNPNITKLEKLTFKLSSGLFGDVIDNKNIAEFTNGEISVNQYRLAKTNLNKKISNLFQKNSKNKN